MSLSAPSPAPAGAPSTEPLDAGQGVPAHSWVDCPRCGEHWPGGAPYCSNCGWMPRTGAAAVRPRDEAAAPAGRDGRLGTWLLAASLALVLAGLLWAWAHDAGGRHPRPTQSSPPALAMVAPPATPPASQTAPQTASPPAAPPASPPVATDQPLAPSVEPAVESAAAARPALPASAAPTEAPAAPARVEAPATPVAKTLTQPKAAAERLAQPSTGQSAGPAAEQASAAKPSPQPPLQAGTDAQLEQWIRGWLAAEAGTGQDPEAVRGFYADRVSYHGQAQASWDSIAADKAAYMRRWPQRHYELRSFSVLPAQGATDERRVTLKLRWRLENQGRWRHGESATSLTLRPAGNGWRIVAEGGV